MRAPLKFSGRQQVYVFVVGLDDAICQGTLIAEDFGQTGFLRDVEHIVQIGGSHVAVDQQGHLARGAGQAQGQLGCNARLALLGRGAGDRQDPHVPQIIGERQRGSQAVDALLEDTQFQARACLGRYQSVVTPPRQPRDLSQDRQLQLLLQVLGATDSPHQAFPTDRQPKRQAEARQDRQGQLLVGEDLDRSVGGVCRLVPDYPRGAARSVCRAICRSAIRSRTFSAWASSSFMNVKFAFSPTCSSSVESFFI